MAGDWIKVEHATPRKPEVLRLARILGVTPDDAFGKVVRFWMWLDENSVDGRVDAVVDADVDAAASHVGFACALQTVGWLDLEQNGGGTLVPNFQRHNGESAKKRGQKAKRQSHWRSRVDAVVDADVDAAVSTGGLPETTEESVEEEEVGECCRNGQDTPKWLVALERVTQDGSPARDFVLRIAESVRRGLTPSQSAAPLAARICGSKQVRDPTGYLATVVRSFESKYDPDILTRRIDNAD